MATNKNAQIRYLTLDRCFRNPGNDYHMKMLLEEFNKVLFEVCPNGNKGKRCKMYDEFNIIHAT